MTQPNRLLASLVLVGLLVSPAMAKSFDEFVAQFHGLAGEEEKADEILRLSDEALATHAKDDARYKATALGYKGHAFFLKKDLQSAETFALQAIEADPTAPLAHFIYTDVLYELERLDEARLSCMKAADLMEEEHRNDIRTMCENSYVFRTMELENKNGEAAAEGEAQAAPAEEKKSE